MNAEERYKAEAHTLTEERDAALVQVAELEEEVHMLREGIGDDRQGEPVKPTKPSVEDCMDPWTCCVHTPGEAEAAHQGEGTP